MSISNAAFAPAGTSCDALTSTLRCPSAVPYRTMSFPPATALDAYERAIVLDPGLLKARINLGCLLHETGRLDQAALVYREAIQANGHDPVLLYNLAQSHRLAGNPEKNRARKRELA